MSADVDPLAVASRVMAALESLGILASIGGSVASSVAGEPRSTLDVDIVVAIEEQQVRPLVAALTAEFYVDEQALLRAVRTRRSANLIHDASQIKIDLFVAGGTPLDGELLSRRRAVEIEGHTLYMHTPEDILLQKLRWFRLGGETSDRQWRDIQGIVRVQSRRLDLEYLRRSAPLIGVTDLLERALIHSGIASR